MAPRSDDINTALDQLDSATTAIGARIQTLIDDINRTAAEGLTGPQTENVLARLGALVPVLTALGSDAANPVPTEPTPTEPPMPGPFNT